MPRSHQTIRQYRADRMRHYAPAIMGSRRAIGTPATILGSSLKGWWDFSDASSLFQLSNGTTAVAADADPIGYATDKSGTGNHLIQATAGLRPLYKTGIQNGRAVARFDVTDDYLRRTASVIAAQPVYVLAVMNVPNSDGGVVWDGVGADRIAFARGIITTGHAELGPKGGAWAGAAHTAGAYHLYECGYNGASSNIVVDGTSLVTGLDMTGDTLNSGFTLGASIIGGSQGLTDCGELLLLNAIPSAAQLTSLRSYLNTRWAVY